MTSESEVMSVQDSDSTFSFRKQPIRSRVTSAHSAISNIIPDTNCSSPEDCQSNNSVINKYRGVVLDEDAINGSVNLNYDEKIRAPRMSLQQLIPEEQTEKKPKMVFIPNQPRKAEEEKVYLPASFDLNQSTRRYSLAAEHQSPRQVAPYLAVNRAPTQDQLYHHHPNDPRERMAIVGPLKQINEPKTPIYVPAVLRPPNYTQQTTSRMNSTGNYTTEVTPRRSRTSLEDWQQQQQQQPSTSASTKSSGPDEALVDEEDDVSSNNDNIDSNDLQKFMTTISQRSSSENITAVEPSHNHWIPNSKRAYCGHCRSKFGILVRRHHCRRCGEIFCSTCLKKSANLNLMAKFDLVHGIACKVCPDCFFSWILFLKRKYSDGENGTTYEEDDSVSQYRQEEREPEERGRLNSVGVVPTDWTWSSF